MNQAAMSIFVIKSVSKKIVRCSLDFKCLDKCYAKYDNSLQMGYLLVGVVIIVFYL